MKPADRDAESWIERWSDNRIGFHQEKINSRLVRLWPTLGIKENSNVFVPLCGKTLDMHWLCELGHGVIGVELSAIACRDFFVDNELEFTLHNQENFSVYRGDRITLLQGDIFDLKESELGGVSAVYDRAALIALPAGLRDSYADHLAEILRPGTLILLISMEYDEGKMQGPPFSVTENEVRKLFKDTFDTTLVAESSGPQIVGNLSERGLDTLTEKIYVLKRI